MTPKSTKEATKFGLKLLGGKQLRYKFLVDFLSHVYIILQKSNARSLNHDINYVNFKIPFMSINTTS